MSSIRIAQAKLLTSAPVLAQLTASLLLESIAVLSEGAAVAGHVNRLKFANAIIASPTPIAQFMLPALLYNANIVASANNAIDSTGTPLLDSDVDALVIAVFTPYANQYAQGGLGISSLGFGS